MISKRLVLVLLLYHMEEGEEDDTVLSEVRFVLPSQVFFKLFRLPLKKFVKYKWKMIFVNLKVSMV